MRELLSTNKKLTLLFSFTFVASSRAISTGMTAVANLMISLF